MSGLRDYLLEAAVGMVGEPDGKLLLELRRRHVARKERRLGLVDRRAAPRPESPGRRSTDGANAGRREQRPDR